MRLGARVVTVRIGSRVGPSDLSSIGSGERALYLKSSEEGMIRV